jgi:thioredoxin reductase
MPPSQSLLMLIFLFLRPIAEKSTFLHERDLIKASKPLNKVLHENRGGLEYIYNKLKGTEKMVSKKKITDFMKIILKNDGFFDIMELHKHFVYS